MATFARARRPSAQRRETVLAAAREMTRAPEPSRTPRNASPAGGWSFADVSIGAPGTGSTALDAEEREGPVGQADVDTAPAQPAQPAQPAAPVPAAPASPSPAATSAPAIASVTMKSAPSGVADTRKKVGVGGDAFGAGGAVVALEGAGDGCNGDHHADGRSADGHGHDHRRRAGLDLDAQRRQPHGAVRRRRRLHAERGDVQPV